MININCQIKQIRKKAGFTQEELAKAIGLKAASSVSMWETGERYPRIDVLFRIAMALNCSVDELYEFCPNDVCPCE